MKPQDYVYPNRLDAGAQIRNWIFVFKLSAMDDSNWDLIFCGETAENRRKSEEKRNGKLECQSQQC